MTNQQPLPPAPTPAQLEQLFTMMPAKVDPKATLEERRLEHAQRWAGNRLRVWPATPL